ncbi:5'-nucleotidase [Purpureocillium takamizusanense]|uniref:5'-nucleotidase n=1 Tax=Purpureocillium takamizusanense TaxID=2060973 RepID=A0A9Q8QAH4_9HYPO|nr:5'-nucleotidase [Purpureocillium takamizusanense]UNI16065.1 5'-nucleotidase [Purpureocillium takamizusanense]
MKFLFLAVVALCHLELAAAVIGAWPRPEETKRGREERSKKRDEEKKQRQEAKNKGKEKPPPKDPEKTYILQSNADGWAELSIRLLNDELRARGHDPFLGAPAEDVSRVSRWDKDNNKVRPRTKPCHYNSCPADTGLEHGYNSTSPHLAWINGGARDSLDRAFYVLSKDYWAWPEGKRRGMWPDVVVFGPNVGSILGPTATDRFVTPVCRGAHECVFWGDTPAIVFSMNTTLRLPWNREPVPESTRLWAELSAMITHRLMETSKKKKARSGKKWDTIPRGPWLNVNYPKYDKASCSKPSDVKFIMTRVDKPPKEADKDIDWCGTTMRPLEKVIHGLPGCFATISFVTLKHSDKKTRHGAEEDLLERLKDIMSCPPEKPAPTRPRTSGAPQAATTNSSARASNWGTQHVEDDLRGGCR